MANEIIIYQAENGKTQIVVNLRNDTVWLTQAQMAELFDVKRPAISKHLKNIFNSGELREDSVVSILETTASDGKLYKTTYYNLDAVISVGYRVNSAKATKFRIWATGILKEYLTKGIAINNKRLEELKQAVKIIKRTENLLDTKQILSVIERYTSALDLLDDYDHAA